jgi:hypothetical protein
MAPLSDESKVWTHSMYQNQTHFGADDLIESTRPAEIVCLTTHGMAYNADIEKSGSPHFTFR